MTFSLRLSSAVKVWGVVAFIGLPNAGKSTLLNHLVGRKLSIVTHKAQTTRRALYHEAELCGKRVILADTPGLFIPNLSRDLYQESLGAVERADLLLLIYDGRSGDPSERLLSFLRDWRLELVIVINKIDLAREEGVFRQTEMWRDWFPRARIFQISALKGTGIAYLKEELAKRLDAEREFFYHPLTREERAAEITREKILTFIHEELPWLARIKTVAFEKRGRHIYVRQIIHVPEERHRAIFIGEGGEKLKMIGSAARKDMEEHFKRKIYVSLEVRLDKRRVG